jgi:hypothetical protein
MNKIPKSTNDAVGGSMLRLVRILAEKGPLRAGELGVEVWASEATIKGKPENNLLTMYCRPATKLLYRAEKLGLVRWREQAGGRYRLWYANADVDARIPAPPKPESITD